MTLIVEVSMYFSNMEKKSLQNWLSLEDLRAGMLLARNAVLPDGKVVLQKGTVLTEEYIQHLDCCGIDEAYVDIDLRLYRINAVFLSEMLSRYFRRRITVDDFELQALSNSLHVSANLFRIIVCCNKQKEKEQFGIIAKHFLNIESEVPSIRYKRELMTLKTLSQRGCHLPSVYGYDDFSRIIYMQDLGEVLLTDIFRNTESSKRQWLLKATETLAQIHKNGTCCLEKSQFPSFDAQKFAGDLMRYPMKWIVSVAGKKTSEMQNLAPLVQNAALCLSDNVEKQFTIPDCNATHMMIHNDKTYVIDVESSTFGLNPLYSLAGLAIAADNAESREEMLFCYLDQRPDFAALFEISAVKKIFDTSLVCVLIENLGMYLNNERRWKIERDPLCYALIEIKKAIFGYPKDVRSKCVQVLQDIQHQSEELAKLCRLTMSI